MSKKKTALPIPSNLLTIGLDIGYGVVKAITDDAALAFPSVCGHAREIKFQQQEINQKYTGDILEDENGVQWFIGELALAQLTPGEILRLRGRTANENTIGNVFRERMTKAVMGKLLAGARPSDVYHVRIATGLPVDHMRDADALKEALLGQHYIKSNAAEAIINVTEVMVMPQPYGTIYAHLLTEDGQINPKHTYVRTGVVDVGTYTVDLALDNDGEYVDADSGSVEGGVYTAHERIAAALERDYREKISPKIIENVLRTGIFRARGQDIDYHQEVEKALAPLRSATLNLISDKWKSGTTIDIIYLSGGGAELVKDTITDAYKQAVLVPESQYANARGYLKYAKFTTSSS